MSKFADLVQVALAEESPFALGILTRIKGSSPQKKGAKALFLPDGRILGTLGGGCLEAELQDRARRALQSGQAAAFDLVLDHDFGWDDGLICGGRVSGLILPRAAEATHVWRRLATGSEALSWGVRSDHTIDVLAGPEEEWLYHETVHLPSPLWIAGAGHVAQAVAPLALGLDFDVVVFDDRPALANPQHFPDGTRFQVDAWERILQTPLSRQPTFGLIATRGHQHDALVLRHWIQQPFAFLGMIGSRRKRRLIFGQFIAEGLATDQQLSAVVCPVGLDIHAVTVPEIALSVMAQFVAVRANPLAPR